MDKLLIAQIDKYFSKNIGIDGRSIWDSYVLKYEHLDKTSIKFNNITIYYHTWEVDEDETMSHISFGNFILRKFDNFDNDF
jgi:hypothetical protein